MNVNIMKKEKFESINILKFGNEIQTVGSILSGNDTIYLLKFPAADFGDKEFKILELSEIDWQSLLNQLDYCQTEVNWNGQKALFRKCQRVIDNFICWQAYKRDKYTCRYCGRDNIPLTVDHVILWEEGGQSVLENLITCCKPCNRERGSLPYEEWLISPYYERNMRNLLEDVQEENLLVVSKLEYLKSLKGTMRTKRK